MVLYNPWDAPRRTWVEVASEAIRHAIQGADMRTQRYVKVRVGELLWQAVYSQAAKEKRTLNSIISEILAKHYGMPDQVIAQSPYPEGRLAQPGGG